MIATDRLLRTFETLDFDNTYARLPAGFFQRATPTPLPAPRLLTFNRRAAALVDLDPAEFARPDAAEYFGGAKRLPGSDPIAQLYSGHQFGSYVPQLGDGRAILLGEARNARGERWDLQLKGSGPTAFSRGFDGRSVLRSAIREYLCSEAMAGLGVPTTRALCVVHAPQQPVVRERVETAAAIVRMAPTHVRFGSFEVFAFRQEVASLRTLADYVLREHFPGIGGDDRYAALLREVVERTARLMAMWLSVGFAHGVMNTDNFSILGLTLDYGPYGFLDAYDPSFICNHSDAQGRYAFDQQPAIGHWNCMILASAMLPLMGQADAEAALDAYGPAFEAEYAARLRAKLGLTSAEPGDAELAGRLFGLMAERRADHTNTFRALGHLDNVPGPADAPVRAALGDGAAVDAWLAAWRERLAREGSTLAARRPRMLRVNPKYILRNYLAQQAITAAEVHGDASEIERLMDLLADPFAERPEYDRYADAPPDWGRHLAVSCSS